MKKIILLYCCIVISLSSFAQKFGDPTYPITFGLSGGSNFAFIQVTSEHRQEVFTNSEAPFSLGFNADFMLNDYFSIRPGISYMGKGGSMNATYVDTKIGNIAVTDDYKLHYFQVQVNAIGHLPLSAGGNIFIGAGPYLARGLNGVNKQILNTADPVALKVNFGNGGDFKPIEYGATGVFGFQAAKGWAISGNLDWGFNNIMQTNTTAFDATQIKTVTFYLCIGQSF